MLSEPFVESVPQLHFTFLLIVFTISDVLDIQSPFFWFTFCTSLITGSLGISKILRNGPAKIISKNKTKDFWTSVTSQLLILSTTIFSLLGKAPWLGIALSMNSYNFGTLSEIIPLWICLMLLPQFIIVS